MYISKRKILSITLLRIQRQKKLEFTITVCTLQNESENLVKVEIVTIMKNLRIRVSQSVHICKEIILLCTENFMSGENISILIYHIFKS